MSWKPEVLADSSGVWAGNALRFATKEEAEANVRDLEFRWFAVRQTRVVEVDDPVTHTYQLEGKARTQRTLKPAPLDIVPPANPEEPS